jgi:hypothetical protein
MSEATEDQGRRRRRMERIDAMPVDIRACVHDYGLSVVDACLQAGVTKGRHIRHIVETVRGGSYQSARDRAPLVREGANA